MIILNKMTVESLNLNRSLQDEIEKLKLLVSSLTNLSLEEIVIQLKKEKRSIKALRLPIYELFESVKRDVLDELMFYSVATIGQAPIVFRLSQVLDENELSKKILKVLDHLKIVYFFYRDLGGILGYHLTVLEQIKKKEVINPTHLISYESPPRVDLTEENDATFEYVLEGINALEYCGELYPIGGLGDRLNLHDEFNQPLPAACLKFEGRTLLEGLIRDVQAREYLYFKLFNRQITVPIALMTSFEKDNRPIIHSICKESSWFGRAEDNFKLFSQPSVPVITQEGNWSMLGELELNLKPGGHGVVWKLGDDEGIFSWFSEKNKTKLLIRQINNPIAGIDYGLLAFVGAGFKLHKTFGLASCPRLVHAAEGVLVLKKEELESECRLAISNIEYTDFEAHGIEDVPEEGTEGYSRFPANTNILYVDLEQFLPLSRNIHRKGIIPGPLINMKNTGSFIDQNGVKSEKISGRLETMMQNVSDWIVTKSKSGIFSDLKTYVTFNHRQKTISVTKRSYESGKTLMETPEGCFYDLMTNAIQLLKRCGFECPKPFSHEDYKLNGPSCIFKYHPALGPLYSIISQKLRGGKIHPHSELQLEIAEIDLENLDLQGSLIVKSNVPLGHMMNDRLFYSDKSSRCSLKNIRVKNRGLKFSNLSSYWKDTADREEAAYIELNENSEFHAEDIDLEGNLSFVVPSNERWTLMPSPRGSLEIIKEPISKATWKWTYILENKSIKLFTA